MERKKPQFSFVDPAKRDPTERMLRLELEDTAVKPAAVAGYNPYDRDPVKASPPKKSAAARSDLRKLSEWIKLKKEVESLKDADPPAPPKVPRRPR
jgi:hypothetical protein